MKSNSWKIHCSRRAYDTNMVCSRSRRTFYTQSTTTLLRGLINKRRSITNSAHIRLSDIEIHLVRDHSTKCKLYNNTHRANTVLIPLVCSSLISLASTQSASIWQSGVDGSSAGLGLWCHRAHACEGAFHLASALVPRRRELASRFPASSCKFFFDAQLGDYLFVHVPALSLVQCTVSLFKAYPSGAV